MATYSLYEIIKPKLSPKAQKSIEDKIRYYELMSRRKGNEQEL